MPINLIVTVSKINFNNDCYLFLTAVSHEHLFFNCLYNITPIARTLAQILFTFVIESSITDFSLGNRLRGESQRDQR